MSTALLIGGTRNLGPDLASALLQAGFRLTILNRGITPAPPLDPSIERLYADRSNEPALTAALGTRDFDAVIDTTLYNGPDAQAAARIFTNRTGRYVMLSTGQVYLVRTGLTRPFVESTYEGPLMPAPPETNTFDFNNWSYGIHKRNAEDALRASAIPLTILRLPMINSERDHYFRLRNYLARVRDGGPILIPAEQPQLPIRHVYGKDVVRAVMRVIELQAAGAFNVGQDDTWTIDEFLARVGATPLRLPTTTLWEHGLMPQCSPFSEPWMSSLDNNLGKQTLGLTYTPMDEYLPLLMEDFHRRDVPLAGYAQRAQELELSRIFSPQK